MNSSIEATTTEINLIKQNLDLAKADSQLAGWNSLFATGSSDDEEDNNEDDNFCPIDMQEFELIVGNNNISLRLLQASSPFNGVGTDETGGVLWAASVCLANHLSPFIVKDKVVLELGCGGGLPSMVAYKYGAKHVVATDATDATLGHVAHHAHEMNNCPNLIVRKLDWEYDTTTTDSQSQMLLLDNDDDEYQAYADIIMASDVIYGISKVPFLVNVMNKYLIPKQLQENDDKEKEKENGIIYFATRNGRRGVQEFRKAMIEANFIEIETISCQQRREDAPQIFQNEADIYRWQGAHTIHVYQRK